VQPQVQLMPGQLSPQVQIELVAIASAHSHFLIVVLICLYLNREWLIDNTKLLSEPGVVVTV
jgi:hypothetical protein